MAFTLTLTELMDVVIMSVVVGYIFMDIFRKPRKIGKDYDPLKHLKEKTKSRFDDFKFAALVTAPAIILHELAHKLIAVSFGMQATFHAAYTWLAIGAVLKLLGTGIIFFVPAFVSITGVMTPLTHSAIAFAGPGMNLLIFVGALLVEKYGNLDKKYYPFLILTKRINLFLFIFNMIPLPMFDGFKVFQGLLQTFM
ncbi:hypothetical protein ACFL96_04560 [Thermoproteota archaeon]